MLGYFPEREKYNTGLVYGPMPKYASTSTLTIPASYQCVSSYGGYLIKFTSSQTVDITASGANGLDTGSEANSTWYYLWAIGSSKGDKHPKGLLSTSYTSPTMPNGYDKKWFTRIAVKNNGSGNFIPFYTDNSHLNPTHFYDVYTGLITGTVGETNVLDGGSSTTLGALSLASFVPPISKLALLKLGAFNSSATGTALIVRPTGQTHNGHQFLVNTNMQFFDMPYVPMGTNASQQIDWGFTANTGAQQADIHVMGFKVTEI